MATNSSPGFTGREVLLVLAVILGILGTLAFTAWRKVRQSSEDKAVMCPIRQLAAAADQYYLENGVSTAAYSDLVGATNYIKAITPIAGETYPTLYIRGSTITVTGVAGARTITYAP